MINHIEMVGGFGSSLTVAVYGLIREEVLRPVLMSPSRRHPEDIAPLELEHSTMESSQMFDKFSEAVVLLLLLSEA